jgi:hypothetical protein
MGMRAKVRELVLLALSRKRLFDFGRHVACVEGGVGCCWGDSELVRVDVRDAMTHARGGADPTSSLPSFSTTDLVVPVQLCCTSYIMT